MVTHVLDMDEVPAASHIHWRAVTSPVLHHAGYLSIIAAEITVAALCIGGAVAMARQVRAKTQPFQAAKSKAVAGLTLGFLLFEGGFVAVGGEWVRHVAVTLLEWRAECLPRSYDDARRADFRLAEG
jgi:predicted small integral membrane protein